MTVLPLPLALLLLFGVCGLCVSGCFKGGGGEGRKGRGKRGREEKEGMRKGKEKNFVCFGVDRRGHHWGSKVTVCQIETC